MAYNPYPYGGYQPVYYPQPVLDQLAQLRQNQQMQPPFPMQVPPAQTPVLSSNPTASSVQNNGILWVGGKQEADDYPVAPNSAVALWDANNPVIYLRQADSTGKPSTKVYDLVERMEMTPQPAAVPQIDLTQFITRDELDAILAERLRRPAKGKSLKEEPENA